MTAAPNTRMSDELCFMPAWRLAAMIRSGEVSSREVVDAFLDRIAEHNPALNAYVTLLEEEARDVARRLESATEYGPLHGVPVAIKDLTPVAGVRTTFGSRVFADFVPQTTASFVVRLQKAGAVVLGKTNTPEFGHKGVTDNLLFGPTSTPYRPGFNAGGSSGGSAAAAAAGLAAVAQGSDGGGSIRIPAAFCGVYGFKPTFGRVPVPSPDDGFLFHTPFIQNGPLTRTVEDAALMLNVMAGPDSLDPFSLPPENVDYREAVRQPITNLRVAYSPNLDVFPVDSRVNTVVERAAKAFEELGARVEEVRLGLDLSQEELSAIWLREMAVLYAVRAEALKREGRNLVARRDELSPEFAELLERGRVMSAMEYRWDDVVRAELFARFQNLFEEYELLLTPTVSVPPFPNGADGATVGPSEVEGEQVDPLIGWALTYPLNFTGHPAASIPAGFTEEGLPIGMQVVGRRWGDASVLSASAGFEQVRPWQATHRAVVTGLQPERATVVQEENDRT